MKAALKHTKQKESRMAEDIKQEEDNPFDALAAIIKPAQCYEEARKLVWTAMKSGRLPEEKVITILLSACAMPALAAANIQMEQILRAHGLVESAPQGETAEEQAPVNTPEPEAPHKPSILRFPNNGQVVN